MDRCHVCDRPILPGQDAQECPVCGRIGHESHGQWGRNSEGKRAWTCDACLHEAMDGEWQADVNRRATRGYWEEAERHVL